MLMTERMLARSSSVAGLGFVSFDQVMTVFEKVLVPLFGIGAQLFLGMSAMEIQEEGLKLQKSRFEQQKAQALLEFSLVKQQYEDSLARQKAAESNILGVPYGNVMILGAGLVIVFMVFAARR